MLEFIQAGYLESTDLDKIEYDLNLLHIIVQVIKNIGQLAAYQSKMKPY